MDALRELVQSVEPDDFWIWTGLLGLSVGWCFLASFRFLKHARLIEDTPTSKLRSASQGYIELEGIARLMDGPPIVCPLTRTHCLWWHYKVEKKVRSGKNESWSTIDKKTSDDFFLLVDDTGQCIVDPAGAEVVPSPKRTWYGSMSTPSGPPPTGKLGGFISMGSGSYRYTEHLVREGDPIYALGLFATHSQAPTALDETTAISGKLAAWKKDPQRMKLFDVNQDGQVDVREWEAARRVAIQEVRREYMEQSSKAGIDLLSRPSLDNQPYILSTVLQKQLSNGYRWKASGCYVWFVGGGALFLTLLIARGVF